VLCVKLQNRALTDRPAIPAALRREVLVEAGHRCTIPTCRATTTEVAHIVPFAEVQEHAFENLIALCPNCHTRYDKGEIDRQSMRTYKYNLGVLASRYVAAPPASQEGCQLPGDIADFVGRKALQGELSEHLRGASVSGGSAGARVAVSGPAGVGKSALVIRVAHSIAADFPDEQLYVNLGAGAGSPVTPAEALAGFLRALRVPEPYPDSLDERSAAYRARLAGKRALVVLDNAGSMEQVRPLLAGSATCAVIVTSRRPLGGLEGAFSRNLETLHPDEAVALLGKLAGAERVNAEPQAAREIAHYCEELPLAVRIAGGRLKNLPTRSVVWLAGRLADERTRLDELKLEDQALRASLTVSYAELSPEQARMFCLLPALPGSDFSTALTAGAAELDEQAAERLLDDLTEAQLLDATCDSRFELHDLTRLFAHEQLEQHPTLTPEAVADRTAAWLRDHADKAACALSADGPAQQAAMAWFEVERESLTAAIETAHAKHDWDTTTAIALDLARFFSFRGYWEDWAHTGGLALHASRHAGDRTKGVAAALGNLADVYRRQARWGEAIANYEMALAIHQELKDRRAEGQTLNDVGDVYADRGHWDQAIASYEQALAIRREQKDRRGEGQTLNGLGIAYAGKERWDEALASYERALAIRRELGDSRGESHTLGNLGNLYAEQTRGGEAIPYYEFALPIHRALGDRHAEARTLNGLGMAYTGQKRWKEAIANYEHALAICREFRDRRGEGRTLNGLGDAYAGQERWDEAIANYEQDLAICREFRDRQGEGTSLFNIGLAYAGQERWDEAIANYEQALECYRNVGDSGKESQVLEALEAARKHQQTP
jgi:tetratricopeptide (TPR) repeat protein